MDRSQSTLSGITVALVGILAGAPWRPIAGLDDVSLGFECPTEVRGKAGEVKTIYITMTTANNASTRGAQGWAVGMGAVEAKITKITANGVEASTIFDHDDDPTTPDQNPHVFDLGNSGFHFSSLAENPSTAEKGAISEIVLSLEGLQTLQPNGTARIALVTLEVPVKSLPGQVYLYFADGFRTPGQVPVSNTVTLNGKSVSPVLGSCRIPVVPDDPATVTLGFEECPALIRGAPGEVKTFEASVTLTTARNLFPVGPHAWVAGVTAGGAEVKAITLAGVQAPTAFDHDADPQTPPVSPDLFPLSDSYIAKAELAVRPSDSLLGAVTQVDLAGPIPQKRWLLPNGTARIARITVEVRIPGTPGQVTLSFADGLEFAAGVYRNVVNLNSTPLPPLLETCSIPVIPDTVSGLFIRGDTNNDGSVDLSDAINLFGVLFLTGSGFTCRDSADSNDSGDVDISDGITILSFQFLGGAPPPSPGPQSCGPDPTADVMTECRGTACAVE